MKKKKLLLLAFSIISAGSCVTKKDGTMQQTIQQQLTVIDSLLRSSDFNLSIAKAQDTAYYTGVGEPVPSFLTPEEDTATITKSLLEERIATSLAGFYALECGLGVLCDRSKEKPTDWLQKIVADKTDATTVLLLNRFANATWKTGQPFRGPERIQRPVFMGAHALSATEVKKDYNQIKTAAITLLNSLKDVKDSSVNAQMQVIRGLLHSQSYAMEMAAVMDTGYHTNLKQPAPAFLDEKEKTATIIKKAKDIKIATNTAGFYAVECCTNYLVTTRNILPSVILQSVVDGSISKEDKDLFARFANATWKASQPFRGLNRIERETFTPFYFLSEADIDKDWAQVKAAAKKILEAL